MQGQANTEQRSTFEVEAKIGKPTMLEESGANYEDSAFKFKTCVAQQHATLASSMPTGATQFPHA